jgi:hypothetical protein
MHAVLAQKGQDRDLPVRQRCGFSSLDISHTRYILPVITLAGDAGSRCPIYWESSASSTCS